MRVSLGGLSISAQSRGTHVVRGVIRFSPYYSAGKAGAREASDRFLVIAAPPSDHRWASLLSELHHTDLRCPPVIRR